MSAVTGRVDTTEPHPSNPPRQGQMSPREAMAREFAWQMGVNPDSMLHGEGLAPEGQPAWSTYLPAVDGELERRQQANSQRRIKD